MSWMAPLAFCSARRATLGGRSSLLCAVRVQTDGLSGRGAIRERRIDVQSKGADAGAAAFALLVVIFGLPAVPLLDVLMLLLEVPGIGDALRSRLPDGSESTPTNS